MITRHYQEELARLKELGSEFAQRHPALAPMLGGTSTDPDVERLLEGVAFQTALLRRKLDDDFPELVHDMVRLVAPHYLRPIPATTIVAFEPKPSLVQPQTVPAGMQLASVPVEGTRCHFRTTSPVEVHPLTLQDASFDQPAGRPPAVTLRLALTGLTLGQWAPQSLRLFLAAGEAEAAELYLLLARSVSRIVIAPAEGGTGTVLPANCLRPAGLNGNEPLIPYPPNAFPGYRLLQEYLTAPRRFFFLELTGWDQWRGRGNGTRFSVTFELLNAPAQAPRVSRESIALFATPAVNLFSHDADPIPLDHRKERHLLRPAELPPGHAEVFSVDRVTAFERGTSREYHLDPFEAFRTPADGRPSYHTSIAQSPFKDGCDVRLALAYPPGTVPPEGTTLSVGLTCTNGRLPESLRVGDVAEPTRDAPTFASFRNITPVTPSSPPPLGPNLLWRLLSAIPLSRLSVAHADNLRECLGLYLFPGFDRTLLAANRRRIEGIERVATRQTDRIVRGAPMRGVEIAIDIRGDHFAGPGDLFLFGSVLDEFMAGSATLNTFTRLTIRETVRGEEFQWPPRAGYQPLL
ncbi:type VI secretion protein, VC_A0110 family [Geobacter metallireducens RCH3]|uniref:Type VI secretion system protein TssF n=1 Tax=Geobacter metallireducens (strain ATCC 53774 / DSM 7210 / GS-15) TaxID=269799 RepID=Q39QE8_GEOMG|nr:type VI secretion system baseplate subunit TssF [Geobacter metallireducens]ABB33526.1 type VI secretion system protein TssF [Geobacter metallireducens GS-15]EHP87633.1 type VI secretion protein, VC_A0110 family [Geobacter metallireducens RCH3]